MTTFRLFAIIVLPFWLCTAGQASPGFRLMQVADPGHKVMTVGLWYPSDAVAPSAPNTKFGHALAVDAPLTGSGLPLVLLSHGYSGWYGGHADLALALASAGYVVAAPSHTGNHFADMTSTVDVWALDRPRHISVTLDFLLQYPLTKNAIDRNRVGVYGFSAGGFTALSLIGAVPDIDHAAEHCRNHPSEFVCAEGMIDVMVDANLDTVPNAAWGQDTRIQAAAIAAPGLAFAYSDKSVKNVNVPVQLWSALDDHSVPHLTNALPLAKRLADSETGWPETHWPETHWIENASHFAFLIIPCRPAFKKADPEEYAFVCGDAEGFNRREFLDEMGQEMIRFFNEALPAP